MNTEKIIREVRVCSRPAKVSISVDTSDAWHYRVMRITVLKGDDEQRAAVGRVNRSMDDGQEFFDMERKAWRLALLLGDVERATTKFAMEDGAARREAAWNKAKDARAIASLPGKDDV